MCNYIIIIIGSHWEHQGSVSHRCFSELPNYGCWSFNNKTVFHMSVSLNCREARRLNWKMTALLPVFLHLLLSSVNIYKTKFIPEETLWISVMNLAHFVLLNCHYIKLYTSIMHLGKIKCLIISELSSHYCFLGSFSIILSLNFKFCHEQ